jgi:hypothetical protein
MLKILRALFVLSFFASFAACGAPDQPEPGTAEEEVRSCSQQNGHCGGFIANPQQCCPGLECQLNRIPDTGGVCVKPVHQKANNGGNTGGGCVCTLFCIQGTTQHCNPDGSCTCR